jgi:hypothetical protein
MKEEDNGGIKLFLRSNFNVWLFQNIGSIVSCSETSNILN